MSIGLHSQCLERLREVLPGLLSQVRVEHGLAVTIESAIGLSKADEVLESSGRVRDRLTAYVGDTPMLIFLMEHLSRELARSSGLSESRGPVPLTSLPAFSDLAVYASRVVADFESLPWDYVFTLKLPHSISTAFAKEIGQARLSDTLTIVTPDPNHEDIYPLPSSPPNFVLPGDVATEKWDSAASYLQMRAEGFVSRYGNTAPKRILLNAARTFAGLGIALRLFRPPVALDRPQPVRYFAHRRYDGRFAFEHECSWDGNQSETFGRLQLDMRLAPRDPVELGDRIGGALRMMESAFSNGDKARRVRLGAQWLFDGFCAEDEALAFVQTVVVLEVLVGDKAVSDVLGIAELLANRCAYLIADSQTGRSALIRELKDTYNVRSRIVHRGESVLTTDERILLRKLRSTCAKVIQREIELLEGDRKSAAKPSKATPS